MKKVWLVVLIMLVFSFPVSAMQQVWRVSLTAGDCVRSLAFSPHGNRLAVGTAFGRLSLFDISSADPSAWSVRPIFDGITALNTPVSALSFDHGQSVLASGDAKGNLRLSSRDGQLVYQTNVGAAIYAINFSDDDSKAMIVMDSNKVLALNMSASHATVSFNHKYFHPVAAYFGSSTGEIIAGYLNASGDMIKGNIEHNRATLETATHQLGLTALVVNYNLGLIATAGQDDTIKLWSLDGFAPLGAINNVNRVLGLAFTPDGSMLVAANADGSLAIWNVVDGVQVDNFASNSTLTDMVVSRVGRYIAASYQTGELKVLAY